MKKFIMFLLVSLFAFANFDVVFAQMVVYPRTNVHDRSPYLEGSLGEVVAHKFTGDELVPVSIIIGDMMIDDYTDEIFISNRYLYRKDFDIKKKIKLNKKTKEKLYGPFEFKFKEKGTVGNIYVHVMSIEKIVVTLIYQGDMIEYTFYPQRISEL